MAAASDMDGLVSRDLYVYYQVAEADASALAARVRAMQQALGAGQLKRRPAASEGLQTLMEIYAGVAADFAARLDAAVAEFGVLALTAGARHTEIFVDLDSGKPAPCA
jgi:hypothetical protein